MFHRFLIFSICGLFGFCIFPGLTALGQDVDDLFNQPPGLFGDAAAEEDAEEPADESEPAAPSGGFSGFGFGSQLTQEQLDQADEVFQTAVNLAEQGDTAAALEKIQEVLAINANHYPSYLLRGQIEQQQGFTEQAIRSLGTATALSPRSFEAYLARGKVYMEVERFRNAITDFQNALSLKPGDPDILYQLGLAQAEFGYSQILGTAQQENIQEAVSSFDLALKIRPDFPEALFERGSARLQLGLLEEAIEDLTRAVELDSENPESVAQLGFASLQRAGSESNRRNGQTALIVADYQNAVDAFTRHLALVPADYEPTEEDPDEILRENIYVARSAANIGLGDEVPERSREYYEQAIMDADAALDLNPEFPSAFYQKGIAQRMLGDLDAAIDSFSEALSLSPGEPEALLRRGIVFFRQGDYELARSDFNQATQFTVNPRANFWAGLANAKLGNYKQAIVEYSTALRYQRSFPLAYFNRGLAYLKVGRFQRAISDFNEVLRADSDNQNARSLRELAQQQLADAA